MQNSVTLRTDTRVVEIDVTVRDSHGKPVEDLQKSDFTITDDGKPREFTIFNFIRSAIPQRHHCREHALPPPPQILPRNTFTNVGQPHCHRQQGHVTVILLDGINGWFDNFAFSRQAVIGMLDQVPADEKIALYVISKGEGLVILQDYTTDHDRLLDAITKYTPRSMCADSGCRYSAGSSGSLPDLACFPAPASGKPSAEDDAAQRNGRPESRHQRSRPA